MYRYIILYVQTLQTAVLKRYYLKVLKYTDTYFDKDLKYVFKLSVKKYLSTNTIGRLP